jgi:hypothetical protein
MLASAAGSVQHTGNDLSPFEEITYNEKSSLLQ